MGPLAPPPTRLPPGSAPASGSLPNVIHGSGRLRRPGPRGAVIAAVRLSGRAAASVVSRRCRVGHRATADHLGRRPTRRRLERPRRTTRPSRRAARRASATRRLTPARGVIAAIRLAMGERMHRAFIDMETPRFEASTANFPDMLYALKKVRPEAFAAAVLPVLPRLPGPANCTPAGSHWMAGRLRELEGRHRSILLVCSLTDWPWIRDAYQRRVEVEEAVAVLRASRCRRSASTPGPSSSCSASCRLLDRALQVKRGRRELTPDDNLSVDGVKEMVLRARDILRRRLPKVADRVTPQLLSIYFRYVRNLCLIERRLTPDLYSLVVAAQQTAGDDLAIAVGEAAREYPSGDVSEFESTLRMGVGRAEVPVWGRSRMVSRLARPVAGMASVVQAPGPDPEGAATRRRGSSAGTRSGCARGRPRTTGSRASSATSGTRPGRSSGPTPGAAPRSSPRA